MRMAFPVGSIPSPTSAEWNETRDPLLRGERSPRRRRSYTWVETALVAAVIMTAVAALGLLILFLVQQNSNSVQGSVDSPVTPLTRSRVVEADHGAVAADHMLCSDIGVGILKRGGNAVDAAIATAFCQGVANPGASGIGGGDFMLIRFANGKSVAYDFRETAPRGASESMYANDIQGKTVGGMAVGVPGEVKGLYEVWQKFGTLPWASLVMPAIRLARKGFLLPPYLASQIKGQLPRIVADKGLRDAFAPGGFPLLEGDLYTRIKLAKTLMAIAKGGSDAFYHGEIAKAMVEDVQAAGGLLTTEDLANYKVLVKKPVVADTWGHTVIGMPPPSSGGVGLILILNILAAFKNVGAIQGDIGVHHIVEAFKHTYAVRSYLGDPDFEDINGVVNDMLSPEFASMLQKTIVDNTTFGPDHYGGQYNGLSTGEEQGTTHFSVVDRHRNVVAMTCTVNYAFGAKFVSQQTGILMNNEMDDFSTSEDDIADGFPAKANFIKPNKRPLSTMSPTIVLENGQFKAALGAGGGVKILTAVAQVLLHVFGGYDPLEAVTAPRVHHRYLPNVVNYENYTTVGGDLELVPHSTLEFLLDRGHELKGQANGAVTQLLLQDLSRQAKVSNGRLKNNEVFKGKLVAVSDSRKDGYPSGY